MSENNDILIQLEELGKVFYADEVETHALAGVHLQIRRGEFVSIEGPFGLRQIGRCSRSSASSIRRPRDAIFLKANPRRISTSRSRAHPQPRNRFHLPGVQPDRRSDGVENVELPLTYRSMGRTERRRRAEEALERVGMSHRLKHYPSQLSGGQQQRVAVARALAGNPSVLLADEPTGNLDSKNSEAVMELLRDLHESGATLCIVTHDPRYASWAKRQVHLFDGRVVDDGAAIQSARPGLLRASPAGTFA